MFSEMIEDLNRSNMPDPAALAKRFDFALTKKMGVIKLPPAFWMSDAKINPRSEHLLWAAMLLLDRERIDSALSVMAVEFSETSSAKDGNEISLNIVIAEAISRLFKQMPDASLRHEFAGRLKMVLPEYSVNEQDVTDD